MKIDVQKSSSQKLISKLSHQVQDETDQLKFLRISLKMQTSSLIFQYFLFAVRLHTVQWNIK